MNSIDEVQLYRGKDIYITDKIVITQPTLEEIVNFGEETYFKAINTFTSVGADLKWQLWDYFHVDYTKISDYDLFVKYISKWVSSGKLIYKELSNNPEKYADKLSGLSKEDIMLMIKNPLELILRDIDFADFIPMKKKYSEDNEQVVLYEPNKDIIVDRMIYSQMVSAIRKIHGFKRNGETPMNERTKMDLIEDARDDALFSKDKPFKSIILPMLSTLKLKAGQLGNEKIWNMKINEFFYDAKRLGIIEESHLLLQGAYSGFASLKGVDKEKLDMFRTIEI